VASSPTVSSRPPDASTTYDNATKETTLNSRNMMVSVRMTPREPEYSVNSVYPSQTITSATPYGIALTSEINSDAPWVTAIR
jgi:hypothetical protein